jgi:hypothetical protein
VEVDRCEQGGAIGFGKAQPFGQHAAWWSFVASGDRVRASETASGLRPARAAGFPGRGRSASAAAAALLRIGSYSFATLQSACQSCDLSSHRRQPYDLIVRLLFVVAQLPQCSDM